MWFKSLMIYRLHAALKVNAEALDKMLSEDAAKPINGIEARRTGWAPPGGRKSKVLVHEVAGHRLLTAMRQDRLLPAAVVAEEVEERVAEIEQREGRFVTRKEKSALKEEVAEALLPQAFVKTRRVDVWWDTRRGLIGINTASRPLAEEVLDLLRETLGSLKVTPLATRTLPVRAMTEWLAEAGSRPAGLELGDTVLLEAKGDDGVMRGRQLDLDADDVQGFIESGRQATQLGVGIEGLGSLVLTDSLALRQIRFADALIEEADHADDGDDPIARLDTDFIIMAEALAGIVERVTEWMGGEAKPQPAETE